MTSNEQILGEIVYHLQLALNGTLIAFDHDVDVARLEDMLGDARDALTAERERLDVEAE